MSEDVKEDVVVEKVNPADYLDRYGMPTESFVAIAEDGMSARLFLLPKKDGTEYTKSEIMRFLETNGVKSGYLDSNIAAVAKKRIHDRDVKIAVGSEPSEGTAGYYEYFFDTGDYRKNPKIREDGSVDYLSMSLMQNVKEGALVAKYHPAVSGKPGFSVTGQELPAKLVKELPALKGRGFKEEPADSGNYVAIQDGKIEFDGVKLEIREVLEVSGNVDALTGKLEFYGDVTIMGNVEAGTIVRAGKSLTIEGSVSAADLYAGGDIVLKRGIQGANRGKVVSKGSVYADFIEHATVETVGNVNANIILNSQISAEENVIVSGKKGNILGGYVHGLRGIEATNIGNDVELPTVVHAGCESSIIDQMRKVDVAEAKEKKNLEELLDEMREVMEQKKTGRFTNILEQKLVTLNKEKDALFTKLDDLRKQKEANSAMMGKGMGASVRINGNLYRGTMICVGAAKMPIINNTCFMEYRNMSGMVVGNVIVIN